MSEEVVANYDSWMRDFQRRLGLRPSAVEEEVEALSEALSAGLNNAVLGAPMSAESLEETLKSVNGTIEKFFENLEKK